MSLKEKAARFVKKSFNVHKPGKKGDVFVFAMPRGGSTWLMELISTQPQFKYINEPFNLRSHYQSTYFGFTDWKKLYQDENLDKVLKYIKGISSGKLTFHNPLPFRDFYRPYTTRSVFKIIHSCEDKVDNILENPKNHAIVLLRHPIAVAISRKALPRLESFIDSDFANKFTSAQIDYAKAIVENGNHLEKAMVSWCFQNALLLKSRAENKSIVTYEQLVKEPDVVLDYLNGRLKFERMDKIVDQLNVPSRSSKKSKASTTKAISGKKDPDYILSKWRKDINPETEASLMKILEMFGIDAYKKESLVSDKYWIK